MKIRILILTLYIISCENSAFEIANISNPENLVQTLIISKSKPNFLEDVKQSPIKDKLIESERRFFLSRLYLHDTQTYELYMHFINKYKTEYINGVRKVDHIDLGLNVAANRDDSKVYVFNRHRNELDPDSIQYYHWYTETFSSFNNLPYFMSGGGYITLSNQSAKQIELFEKKLNFSAPLFLKTPVNNQKISHKNNLKLEFNKYLNSSYDMITFFCQVNGKEIVKNFRFTKSENYLNIPSEELLDFYNDIKLYSNESQFKIKLFIISSGGSSDQIFTTVKINNATYYAAIVEQQISRYELTFN